jgi:hypothetical protein
MEGGREGKKKGCIKRLPPVKKIISFKMKLIIVLLFVAALTTGKNIKFRLG